MNKFKSAAKFLCPRMKGNDSIKWLNTPQCKPGNDSPKGHGCYWKRKGNHTKDNGKPATL